MHTWIVTKPAEDDAYTRWDVVGWGGGRVVRRDYASPDAMWYGHHPRLLVDLRGPEAAALIPAIEAAVESYPHADRYRSWPGPNSNTFVAHVGRSVPGLRLDLPPTAIGKDFRSEEHTSELQSLMRISYAVFCLKKKRQKTDKQKTRQH